MSALYKDAQGVVRRIVETVEVTEEKLVKEIDDVLAKAEELKQELVNFKQLTGEVKPAEAASAPADANGVKPEVAPVAEPAQVASTPVETPQVAAASDTVAQTQTAQTPPTEQNPTPTTVATPPVFPAA